jgi:hypothetical protein
MNRTLHYENVALTGYMREKLKRFHYSFIGYNYRKSKPQQGVDWTDVAPDK